VSVLYSLGCNRLGFASLGIDALLYELETLVRDPQRCDDAMFNVEALLQRLGRTQGKDH
jgi:hypothetical protein